MIKEENGKKIIDILDKVLYIKYWRMSYESIHYSGHRYFRSPFESDDNCGTCDGARCDYCRKIVDKADLEFSICTGTLYSILLEEGVPKDIASELAYSDFCGDKYKDYILIWPDADKLKERYPDKYEELLKNLSINKNLMHPFLNA